MVKGVEKKVLVGQGQPDHSQRRNKYELGHTVVGEIRVRACCGEGSGSVEALLP